MRREWIEIVLQVGLDYCMIGLPPCGGSGLKFAHRLSTIKSADWSLPPCGGSGLK